MDHCPYGSLKDLVEWKKVQKNNKKPGLPWKMARHFAGQIVSFIEEAHKNQGIAHTRLNPQLCRIDSKKRLKIADFRFA